MKYIERIKYLAQIEPFTAIRTCYYTLTKIYHLNKKKSFQCLKGCEVNDLSTQP